MYVYWKVFLGFLPSVEELLMLKILVPCSLFAVVIHFISMTRRKGYIGLEGPMRSRAELEELEKELYAERIKAEILTLRISQRRMLEEEARHDLEVSCAVSTTEQLRRSREPSQIQVTQGPSDKVTETKRKLPRKIAGPSNNLKLKPDWSCALCQVSITSEKALNDHLQGKKHRAKVAAELSSVKKAPEPPLLENESHNRRSSSTPTPTQENWSCTLCQVSITSEKALNDHLQGKKHQAKVAAESSSIKKAPEPPLLENKSHNRCSSSTPTPTQENWSCTACGIKTTTEHDLDSHLQGKKHKAKAAELESNKKSSEPASLQKGSCDRSSTPTYKPTGPTPTQENWSCTACVVRTTSEHDLNSHLKGKKHKAKAAELESNKKSSEPASLQKGSRDRSPTPTYKPTGQVKEGPKGGSKVMFHVDGMMREVLEEGAFLWCTLCNVKCNSKVVMVHHFRGKKHLAEESRRGR